MEAAEPTSAAEYYETPSDRAAAEAREDRVNDKFYTMGQGKMQTVLQKMPIGEDRDNNYIKLEEKLLKGKQAVPGMQAMAKPPKPLTLGETQFIIKKLDAQANTLKTTEPEAIDEFVRIANGEAPAKAPPLTLPPEAAAAIAASKTAKATWSLSNSLLGRMFGAANVSPTAQDMATRIKEAGGLMRAGYVFLQITLNHLKKY